MKLFSTSWRLMGVGTSFSRLRVKVFKRGRNASLYLKYLEPRTTASTQRHRSPRDPSKNPKWFFLKLKV